MTRENLHRITGYPESVDLRYYAATYSDKQKTSRLLEQQLERSNLDEKLFKIKRKPLALNINTRVEYYKDPRCRHCFKVTDSLYTNNYYASILDLNQLFFLRNSAKLGFKFLRLIGSKNDRSIDVSDTLIKNEELLNFIKEYELYERAKDKNKAEERTPNSMISYVVVVAKKFAYNLSSVTLKFIGIVIYAFSWMFISRLVVSSAEIKNIRTASKRDLPLIYLLKNPSSVDWFIVLMSLFFMDFKIPVVMLYKSVSSKSLRWFLRKCGVIFICPPTSDIHSSNTKHVLSAEAWVIFMEELIRAKNHFIAHLDTPDSVPDDWIMKTIADSIRRKAVDDILVSPVIVNREKSAEELYLEKYSRKSLYSKLIDIFFYRKLNLGFVKLNFFEPFSFKDLIHASAGRNREVSQLSIEEIFSLTTKIITHINYDFCRFHPIMTTDLLSYLLLKKYRKEVPFTKLVSDTSALIDELKARGIRMGFTGNPSAVVEHALCKLGPELVTVQEKDEKIVMPILDVHAILKTAHYAHKTMMHFMMDAVLFTSISLIFPEEFKSSFKVNTALQFTFSQLMKAAERVRDVLQFEYTFEKFCESFEFEVENTILKLCNDDIIIKDEKMMIEEEVWAHKYAKHLEDDDFNDDYNPCDDYDDEDFTFDDMESRRSPSPTQNFREKDDSYSLNLTGEKSLFEQIMFYRNALKPYLDAYLCSAEHLNTLIDKQVPIQYYCKTLAEKVALMLSDGRLSYPETSSSSVLQNTVKLFAAWDVIAQYRVNDIEFITLSQNCDESKLMDVAERTKILL